MKKIILFILLSIISLCAYPFDVYQSDGTKLSNFIYTSNSDHSFTGEVASAVSGYLIIDGLRFFVEIKTVQTDYTSKHVRIYSGGMNYLLSKQNCKSGVSDECKLVGFASNTSYVVDAYIYLPYDPYSEDRDITVYRINKDKIVFGYAGEKSFEGYEAVEDDQLKDDVKKFLLSLKLPLYVK